MNWIEKIRQKPQEQKLRLVWAVAISAIVILAGLWIVSAKFSKDTPKDTTLFKTINQGVKDVKESMKK